MKTVTVQLDEQTYTQLQEMAGRDLRPASTFILILLRREFGLPYPYEESPLVHEPGLLPKGGVKPDKRLRSDRRSPSGTTVEGTQGPSGTTVEGTQGPSGTTVEGTQGPSGTNGNEGHQGKGKRTRPRTHDEVEVIEGGIPDGE